MRITKRVAAAGAAGLITASGLGLVVLGTSPAVAATATAESGTTSRLQAIKDALAGLVSDGSITQAQADEVAGALDSSDALRGHGGRGGFGRGLDLDAAATALGMSAEDLRTALQADGATLASVAEEEGVEEQVLVDALVAAGEERLEQAVTDGRLTRAEADERIADLPDRVAGLVDQEVGAGRGPSGRGPRDGDAPAGQQSGSTTTEGTSAT